MRKSNASENSSTSMINSVHSETAMPATFTRHFCIEKAPFPWAMHCERSSAPRAVGIS
jgi:hypothetical protein